MYIRREMPIPVKDIRNWQAKNDERFGIIVQSFCIATINVEECLERAKQAWLDSEEGQKASEETRLIFSNNMNATQYLIQFMRKIDAKYPELFPIPETIQRG